MAHMTPEVYKSQVRAVWVTTVWLSVITIIEVVGALVYPEAAPRMLLNIFLILASLLKAFFIAAEFMHLKYEIRALVITILAPLFFLIWFIIAFLWEGVHWLDLKLF